MAIPYNSNYEGTRPFSDITYQIKIATGEDIGIAIPGTAENRYQACFSYNATSNIFVGLNVTPTIPTTDLGQPYVDFRPENRYVNGGDVLQFATPDAAQYVGVSLSALP